MHLRSRRHRHPSRRSTHPPAPGDVSRVCLVAVRHVVRADDAQPHRQAPRRPFARRPPRTQPPPFPQRLCLLLRAACRPGCHIAAEREEGAGGAPAGRTMFRRKGLQEHRAPNPELCVHASSALLANKTESTKIKTPQRPGSSCSCILSIEARKFRNQAARTKRRRRSKLPGLLLPPTHNASHRVLPPSGRLFLLRSSMPQHAMLVCRFHKT